LRNCNLAPGYNRITYNHHEPLSVSGPNALSRKIVKSRTEADKSRTSFYISPISAIPWKRMWHFKPKPCGNAIFLIIQRAKDNVEEKSDEQDTNNQTGSRDHGYLPHAAKLPKTKVVNALQTSVIRHRSPCFCKLRVKTETGNRKEPSAAAIRNFVFEAYLNHKLKCLYNLNLLISYKMGPRGHRMVKSTSGCIQDGV